MARHSLKSDTLYNVLALGMTTLGLFRFFPPPSPTDKIIIPPPLADMLSWAVWFKFLLNKVIANTCSFVLTSSASTQLLGRYLRFVNCVHCLLTRERRIQWINTCTGSSSYSFDWGEIIRWGGRNGKDPLLFLKKCLRILVVWTQGSCQILSVISRSKAS